VSLVFNSKKTRLRGFFFVVKIFQFGALKVFPISTYTNVVVVNKHRRRLWTTE